MSKLSFLSEDLAEGPVCSLITFQQLFFIYLCFLIQTWLMKKKKKKQMMSMLLTKKHKTLQHKKLSWTSQNLSKKNYFLPRPTSVLMPLWMWQKLNRAGWDQRAVIHIDLQGIRRCQLSVCHTDSEVIAQRDVTHRVNGEEQLSRTFRGPSSLDVTSWISAVELFLASGE